MKIGAVITAAGCSKRMGEAKLLMKIGQKTILEHTLSGIYNVADEIVIVTGCYHERMRKVLENYNKVKMVYNSDYQKGMFSSVLRGIQSISADRIFIVPGDCPLIQEEIYRKLLTRDEEIVIPSYKGRGGHPVLISKNAREKLLKEPPNSTLKDFIKKYGVFYLEVDSDVILKDMDTPEDFEIIKERLKDERYI